MDIKECAWCGKAIYGDDYYYGSHGYYHKDCQMRGMRRKVGGGGGADGGGSGGTGRGGGQGGVGASGGDGNKTCKFINDGEYMSIGSGGTPVHGQSVYKASGPLEVIITPGSNGNININVIWRGEGE